jgi:hypothetical protein
MSRKIAITLSIVGVAAAAAGCATTGDCEDCIDHSSSPDGGLDDMDDPDGPQQPGDGPILEVVPTRVRDELKDAITFTADGAPRDFEHVGLVVELGGDGCPVVHKHAFLLRRDHGATESPKNPVELRFRATAAAGGQIDPDGGAYRVRLVGAGDALTDWLPAAGTDGLFTAVLDRTAVPELVSVGGPFEVEMRARDLSGRETIATRCVDLRPIAGPLAVGAVQAMPRFSLMYRDPVSPILNGKAAWPVIRVTVANATPDPVFAQLERSAVTGTCSKHWQRWNVLTSISTGAQSCESDPTLCAQPDLDPVIDHDAAVACNPALGSSSSRFDLTVAIDGAAVEECTGCAAGEYRLPPMSKAVVTLVAVDVPGLQPRESSEPEEIYADQEVAYRTTSIGAGSCPGGDDCATMFVTGRATSRSGCMKSSVIDGNLYCNERRTYKMVRALTTASAEFDRLSIDVTGVALRATGEQTAPTGYGAPRVFDGYLWSTSAGSNVPDA